MEERFILKKNGQWSLEKWNVEKRCWEGYEPVPGKEPYEKGSCRPVKKVEVAPKDSVNRETYKENFEKSLEKAKHLHDKYGKEMYAATKPHQGVGGHLESYINSTVRSGEKPSSEGLKEFIASKYQKKIKDLKTPAAQGRKQAELQQHHSYIDKNKKHYDHLLKMHGYLQEAKNKLVSVLNQHEGGLEHHISGNRTDPEGFVFHPTKTKDTDGSPIKLVNRAEFSRANLLKVR